MALEANESHPGTFDQRLGKVSLLCWIPVQREKSSGPQEGGPEHGLAWGRVAK